MSFLNSFFQFTENINNKEIISSDIINQYLFFFKKKHKKIKNS